jgi:hypothetical protein
LIIGHSTTSTIRASKTLDVAKSVFRISNIDACYEAEDVKQYIESLNVRVVSCFERTSEKARSAKKKNFRVCIFDADKALLLNETSWSIGISIQRWVFKPKPNDQGSRSGDGGALKEGISTERANVVSNTACGGESLAACNKNGE